ncbi:MAG: nuclear transport factor 2 family protein [Bacteroidetes bacterium]|nr:nuclear transport factor 2 family protein [Bacteroidota bacterium]
MTTQAIADRLTELCRQGQFETAQKELFSKDAISVEPEASQGFAKETKGLDAIIKKGHQFEQMVEETHSVFISTPLVSNNAIAFALTMDVTMKGRDRATMSELCVYQVKDGKIIKEEFYM